MDAAGATGLLSALIALLSLLLLRPLAYRVGLLDRPGERKIHSGAVPLTGGLSVFIGLLAAWLISMPFSAGYGMFLLCSLLLVLLGAVDDARDVPARFRLWAQVTLGTLLVYGSGVWLNTFGNLLGFGEVRLGWLGPIITVAAIIGATNAFNMIDGIDGLAGSMSGITLGALAILFLSTPGFIPEATLAIGIVAAMIPFLLANLGVPPFRHKIFMGDAGSMFIGFAVVWLLTKGTQADHQAFRPVTALWIVALPLMDMVAIMVRRARKGQSVMKPDRDHLHHIFMRAGFSDREALLVITLIALMFAIFGLAGDFFAVPEWLMFALFLGTFAGYEWALSHAWRLLVLFRKSGYSK